jgi:hypothetical protein
MRARMRHLHLSCPCLAPRRCAGPDRAVHKPTHPPSLYEKAHVGPREAAGRVLQQCLHHGRQHLAHAGDLEARAARGLTRRRAEGVVRGGAQRRAACGLWPWGSKRSFHRRPKLPPEPGSVPRRPRGPRHLYVLACSIIILIKGLQPPRVVVAVGHEVHVEHPLAALPRRAACSRRRRR